MNPYTLHISLYDVAFLGVIFIALNFAMLLACTRRTNKAANRYLALALIILVLWMVRVLGVDIRLQTYIPYWNRLPLQFSLGFGPLIYFYVLKLTRPQFRFRLKDLLHFGPLLLELSTQVFANTDRTPFQQLNPAVQFLAFVSVFIYLYLSHRQIERFYRRLKFIGGDRYRYELRWLHRLLTSFGLLWLLWIPYTALDYFYYHYQLGIQAYYPLYLFLSGMATGIAVAAFLKTEVSVPVTPPLPKPRPPAELKQKGIWLKNEVRTNLYYQDPELSLGSLAEKLGLTVHELSRIINTALKKSFNDFINEYRVIEVIWKMQEPAYDHMTLLGIAYDSGFNSRTTFHRIFKQMTGKSPADYKTDHEKGIPSYNLEHHYRLATVISNQETTPMWTGKKLNRNYMFKNYFKTAWRNLKRNKSYAAINITGLAIGIASCLLIFLIVQYETSFDNFHAKKTQIYRVVTMFHGPDGIRPSSGTPLPLAEGLRIDFPQLKQVSAIMQNDGSHYSIGNSSKGEQVKKFKEDLAYYAEPQFFQIFDFKWLAGDKKTALAEPNSVVLTRDEADKFFGNWHDAMGKVIKQENTRDLKVTGILENTPANTDFPMKLVVSYVTMTGNGGDFHGNEHDWVSTFGDNNCYIILPAGMNVSRFNDNLKALTKKRKPVEYAKDVFALQPLDDLHYNTDINIYGGHSFGKSLIKTISIIGLFLLIIACVNFINLATAQAVNRSKEVGIRKVLGSNRNQLVVQFISETLIITLFAVVLAVGIAIAVLPMLNKLLEIELAQSFLGDPTVLLFLIGTVVSVTLLSGFYPALVLSGYNPIEALKNKIKAGSSAGVSLRRILVVGQFFIAQVLVIGTLVLIYQMDYFRTKSLGFDKDAIITVSFPGDSISRTKINTLKDQLLQQPGIKDISFSFASPSDLNGWNSDFKFNNAPKQTDFSANLKWADAEYFKLYGMQFVAGQPYNKSDTINGYVVNETLIHKLGIRDPKDVIGKYVMLWNDKTKYAQIKGVVKDFNVSSLKREIPAVLMAPWKGVYQKLNIKIEPKNASQTLASVEKLWNATFPDGMYEYQFLDDKIAGFYKKENQLSQLYKIFAGIAIFISCLGLYGLVSFMAVQRTKEVGIRKTLGASVGHIVYLFSKEFTVLVVIAFGIAAPTGYYFMYNWLKDFTYKITIGPGIFLLSIFASLAIAWITVGYKAVRAAMANPVKSLRSE